MNLSDDEENYKDIDSDLEELSLEEKSKEKNQKVEKEENKPYTQNFDA